MLYETLYIIIYRNIYRSVCRLWGECEGWGVLWCGVGVWWGCVCGAWSLFSMDCRIPRICIPRTRKKRKSHIVLRMYRCLFVCFLTVGWPGRTLWRLKSLAIHALNVPGQWLGRGVWVGCGGVCGGCMVAC